jgi:predicted DNA-binding transcriptional regulator AlpA
MPEPANDNWPIVLTRPEAAAMCGISLSTFDNWVRKDILPGPICGTRRWSRVAIERALSDGLTGPSMSTEHSPFAEWKRANAN